MTIPIWQWDEHVQRGTDYAQLERVRVYDERMADLRDVSAESQKILELLEVSADDVVLEIGTGTGAFAREAARRCRKVIALDVAPVMLDYARERAREESIENIDFQESGFLTYQHGGDPLAAVVSQLTLHHLPDTWKLIALRRVAAFMREEGRLYLSDVVFPDRAQTDWSTYFQELVDSMPGDRRVEMAQHIREEFSTFDWMVREVLLHAGFRVESAELQGAFLGRYLCRRTRIPNTDSYR